MNRRTSAAAAVLSCVCGCTFVQFPMNANNNDNSPPTNANTDVNGVHDFSDFTRFDYERRGSVGFCPPVGGIYKAAITRDESGEYELAMSVLAEGDAEPDQCIDEITVDGCFLESAFTPRGLYLEEKDSLRSLFSAIETVGPLASCADMDFELCDVEAFTWDESFTATDHPCAEHRVAAQIFSGLLENMRRRSAAIVSTVEDFSGFTNFRYEQMPGLGFCPMAGELLNAEIIRNEEGDYTFSGNILDSISAPTPDCPADPDTGACVTSHAISARPLTDAEVAAMRSVFSAVTLSGEPEPICEQIAIDPCVVRTATWNIVSFTDFPCTTNRVEIQPIVDLLAQFANAN